MEDINDIFKNNNKVTIWDVLKTFQQKKLLPRVLVDKYLSKKLLIMYFSFDKNLLQKAKFMVNNLLNEDLYTMYLYAYHNYPAGKYTKWIKKEVEPKQFQNTIDIVSSVLDISNEEAVFIYDSISKDELLKIEKHYKDEKEFYVEDKIDYFDR